MTANHAAARNSVSVRRPDWPQIKNTLRLVAGWDSTARVRDLVDVNRYVNAPVPSGRRIVVTGTRAGAGATTIAAIVTSLLATRRRDPVLAVDGAGTTPHPRLDVVLTGNPHPAVTVQQTAGSPPQITTRDHAATYLASAGAHAWLLPQSSANPGHPVDARTYDAAVRPFGRFFDLTVTDLGTSPAPDLAPMLLQQAHALCVVVPAESDALHVMNGQLQQLFGPAATADMPWMDRITVVVNDAPRPGRRVGEHRRADPRLPATIGRLRRQGTSVVQIRSDSGLHHAPLALDALHIDTQRAAVRLAAALLGTAAPATIQAEAPRATAPAGIASMRPSARECGWFINGSTT